MAKLLHRFEKQLLPNNDVSLYSRFDDQVQIRPYAIALVFENQSYIWQDLEIASNRMAHWYQSQGIQPKDCVAMFMTNSPLFVISWLAVLKIKAVTAFINNQITGPLLVFDYELIGALHESIDGIREMGYRLFTVTPKDQVLPRLEEHREKEEDKQRFYGFMEWRQCSAEGYSRDTRRDVVIDDTVALIYISGTTGFPKAAVMDHGRCASAPVSGQRLQDARDKDHKVRLMFGNGMRPDVWCKFQERFGVKTVFKSCTMSEATSALFNLTSGDDDSAVLLSDKRVIFQPGLRIVKVDLDTEELIKDKNGYCIECDYGETGELITLADKKTSQSRYIGYYNQPKLSNAKLIQNAFEERYQYMRTGDLLYRTNVHFWYFADRAGDTFRWKGENVSTAEVADTLGHVDGVTSCTRAGMAAIVLKDEYWDSPIKQEELDKSKNLAIRLVNEKAIQDFVDRLSRHAAAVCDPTVHSDV
ncbi:hypothetical protein BG005_004437 [Podila minutissima]|nr:hypothetical protein BG005_004437 [Podila minutissima]